MRIASVHIENFRSIRELTVELGDRTVFVGPNNSGKSAILDAIRIVLTRRWGPAGTALAETDIHRPSPDSDPRTLPPIRITLVIEERQQGEWSQDLLAALSDILIAGPDRIQQIRLLVTYGWKRETNEFTHTSHFLDQDGESPLNRRPGVYLTRLFEHMPLFWLGALRDAREEFHKKSGYWAQLMDTIQIPETTETEILDSLDNLDAKIVESDPKLHDIAQSISQSTTIAIKDSPGTARISMLPVRFVDILRRAAVVLRNDDLRPWLPLDQHGQGLQSLSVIFMFQAAIKHQISDPDQPDVEAVFAIEEPEAHLHPQAVRELYGRLRDLTGQSLYTTHSPYFLQNVPIDEVRRVHLRDGVTCVESIAKSRLKKPRIIETSEGTLRVHDRRPLGEIFFANSWLIVEGETEEILCHAIGKGLDRPLDRFGVSVVNAQGAGNIGIYCALAEAFQIPWRAIVDNDDGGNNAYRNLLNKRGFLSQDLEGRFEKLVARDLEAQLVLDGHAKLLHTILFEGRKSPNIADDDLVKRIRKKKPDYMRSLAMHVEQDREVAYTDAVTVCEWYSESHRRSQRCLV